MRTYAEIMAEIDKARDRQRELAAKSKLTSTDQEELWQLEGQIRQLDIDAREAHEREAADAKTARPINRATAPARTIGLRADQRLSDSLSVSPIADFDLGRAIVGMATGEWSGPEFQALSGGSGAGEWALPAPVSTEIIDNARALSVVNKAGAITVPMETSTLKVVRVTSDPVATWRAPGAAVNVDDPGIDAVTLQAHTLAVRFALDQELFEDVPSLGTTLTNILARAFAAELDRAALIGSGSGEEPEGIAAATGIGAIASAGNITYQHISNAVKLCRASNHEPGAVVMSPRSAAELDQLAAAGDGQFLVPPRSFDALTQYVTSSIPETLGTSPATKTEVIVGNFAELIIGMRTNVSVSVAPYVDGNLQRPITAWMRADVALAHPSAFTLISGVTTR